MPPDGYDTVTLPEDVVADLDAHADQMNARSRAEAIRALLSDGDAASVVADLQQEVDSLAFDGAMSDDRADEIIARLNELESHLPEKVAEEMEGRMR